MKIQIKTNLRFPCLVRSTEQGTISDSGVYRKLQLALRRREMKKCTCRHVCGVTRLDSLPTTLRGGWVACVFDISWPVDTSLAANDILYSTTLQRPMRLELISALVVVSHTVRDWRGRIPMTQQRSGQFRGSISGISSLAFYFNIVTH